mmetsp:Transcript_3037/g.4491  ORF Transcript_3037/g.4491 Transcript_3037/m.4491 type:complete len:566 (+) Transcript_3037:1762-3459(+)
MKLAAKCPSSRSTFTGKSIIDIDVSLNNLHGSNMLQSRQKLQKPVTIEHAFGLKLPSIRRSNSEPNLSRTVIHEQRCENCGYILNNATSIKGKSAMNRKFQDSLLDKELLSNASPVLYSQIQNPISRSHASAESKSQRIMPTLHRNSSKTCGEDRHQVLHGRKLVSKISPVPYSQWQRQPSTTKSRSQVSTKSKAPCSLMTKLYRNTSKPFDGDYQQASTSLLLLERSTSVTVPGPPALESYISSKKFLMSQPMIQSPAPTAFSGRQESTSSSVIRSQVLHRTPLYKKSFQPTIFSVTSSLSTFDACYGLPISGSSTESEESSHPGLLVLSKSHAPHNHLGSRKLDQSDLEVKIDGASTDKKIVEKTDLTTSPESKANFSKMIPSSKKRPIVISTLKKNVTPRREKILPDVDITAPLKDGERKDGDVGCSCQRSKCLKLYCVCFQQGLMCKDSCVCLNCKNNHAYSGPGGYRNRVIESIKKRRPDAFGKRVREFGLGCGCQKNRCLKKYCSCFAEKILCDDDKCSCENCYNKEGGKTKYRKSSDSSTSTIYVTDHLTPVHQVAAI